MGRVQSFDEYTPSPRYDNVAWAHVQIYEAPAATGPWTLIDTLDLDPLDSDPKRPDDRSFSTSNAGTADGLWYRVAFTDDEGGISSPTEAVQNTPAFDASTMYITPEQLKASLDVTSTVVAEEDIKVAIPTACRAVDGITNRFFYLTGTDDEPETRLFSRLENPRRLDVDDIVTLTSVEIDVNNDGDYETMLELGPDYVLEPANAPLKGYPWEEILLRRRTWPTGPQAVRVKARFGWESVPPGVVDATSILAARLVKVIRDATFGVYVTPGLDTATAIRIGRQDPHVMMALGNLIKTPKSA